MMAERGQPHRGRPVASAQIIAAALRLIARDGVAAVSTRGR
jgi:AcrR family transcriptional regulator